MLETRLAHVILPLRMLCLLIFCRRVVAAAGQSQQQLSTLFPFILVRNHDPAVGVECFEDDFSLCKLKLIYNAYKLYHRAYWENNAYRAHEIRLVDFHGIGVSLPLTKRFGEYLYQVLYCCVAQWAYQLLVSNGIHADVDLDWSRLDHKILYSS